MIYSGKRVKRTMTTQKPRFKSLKIGAVKYEIVWDDKLGNIGGAQGATNSQLNVILVDPTNEVQALRDTIMHESFHAMWAQSSLLIRHPDSDRDSEGELIIQDLAPKVVAFIRDNPKVVTWLQSL